MREILFRGKDLKNNEWTEGYYCRYGWTGKEKDYIIPDYASVLWGVEVDSNTIGQYTGLTDKNDVKIFEGDIVKGTAYSGKFVGVIVWIDEIGGFGVRYRKRQEATAWENSSILKCASKGRTDEFTAEVIGNIYDNPELIGGEADD